MKTVVITGMTCSEKSKLEQEAENLFGSMREATKEEQKTVREYVESISENTGVRFFQKDTKESQ